MRGKRRRDRETSEERGRLALAVVDELDVIDEVLRALPYVRRLIRSALSRESGSDPLAEAAGDHRERVELHHESKDVDEILLEMIRWRLRVVAAAVRSMHSETVPSDRG